MSKDLCLDGAEWNSTTRETARQPVSFSIRRATSYENSRSSMSTSLRILDGQPTLPAELLIEIVEQLSTPQARASFCLNKGALKTLASLALLNQTFNRLVTPILYRRIRLGTRSAIESLHSTLSSPARGTYLSSFVKYFFAYDPTDKATSHIPAIITLIRDSVEYVHIDKWPQGPSCSELRDYIATIRSLRQLSVNHRRGTTSLIPRLNDRSIPKSVVLDKTSTIMMMLEFLADASNGASVVVGPNLSVYCVTPGALAPSWWCMALNKKFQQFIATGRDLPPFRIIMLFTEITTDPEALRTSEQLALSGHWYCLPVPHWLGKLKLDSQGFDQWLSTSIEDGSLWEIDPIPMVKWATWVQEKSLARQDDAPNTPNITTEIQTLATQDGPLE